MILLSKKRVRGRATKDITVASDITDLKRGEEVLLESEKRYRGLVETMNEGLEVLDENNLFTYVNDKFCKMLGYSRNKIIGRPITDFVDKPYHNILKEQMARRRKGERESYELVWTGKNRREIFTIISATPILDADGNYRGSFAVNTDITARKRAEEELRKSEEEYRTLFESSADGIIVTDIQTKEFKNANPIMSKILGYEVEELKRMNASEIHPKGEFGHAIFESEVRAIPCLRKDGTTAYTDVNSTKALIRGRECLISFFRDVTKLKRVEEITKSLHDVSVTIQKTMDEETIFNTVGKELGKLDLKPAIYMLDEKKKNAKIKRNVLPPAALAFAERLIGLKLDEFSVPVDKVPAFRDVVSKQKTVVLHNPAETIGQFLVSGEPSRRKHAAQLAGLFGTERAICSPLIAKGEVVGILAVCSKHLVGKEITTIVDAFAHQIGAATENAELYEEVKQKLVMLKEAEEKIRKLSYHH